MKNKPKHKKVTCYRSYLIDMGADWGSQAMMSDYGKMPWLLSLSASSLFPTLISLVGETRTYKLTKGPVRYKILFGVKVTIKVSLLVSFIKVIKAHKRAFAIKSKQCSRTTRPSEGNVSTTFNCWKIFEPGLNVDYKPTEYSKSKCLLG